MGEYPVELEPGKLGCPRCKTPLVEGEAPCYYEGHVIGMFDGIVCDMCDYGLLTQKGFEESSRFIDMLESVLPSFASCEIIVDKDSQMMSSEILPFHSSDKKFEGMDSTTEPVIMPQIQNSKRLLTTNQ